MMKKKILLFSILCSLILMQPLMAQETTLELEEIEEQEVAPIIPASELQEVKPSAMLSWWRSLLRKPQWWNYAATGNVEGIQALINAGIDVNQQDKEGNTVLMGAAGYRRTAIVRLLLNNGADVMIKNKKEKTVYDLAKNEDIKRMIKAKMEEAR